MITMSKMRKFSVASVSFRPVLPLVIVHGLHRIVLECYLLYCGVKIQLLVLLDVVCVLCWVFFGDLVLLSNAKILQFVEKVIVMDSVSSSRV